MTDKEVKVDHLDVDTPIPGQEWVCISFVSPDELVQEFEAFKACKFLKSYFNKENLDENKLYSEYLDYTYKYQKEIKRDFDEKNNFQTSTRGVKVRGVYQTRELADSRAKSLTNVDSTFNVFVGQVGYWLPWDPCADNIEEEVYSDEKLNELMKNYKENKINKDIFYEQEKQDKIRAAREEYLRNKKLKEEQEEEERAKSKLEEIEDVEDENEDTSDPVEEIDTTLNKSMTDSLENLDPWMKNKIENQKEE